MLLMSLQLPAVASGLEVAHRFKAAAFAPHKLQTMWRDSDMKEAACLECRLGYRPVC